MVFCMLLIKYCFRNDVNILFEQDLLAVSNNLIISNNSESFAISRFQQLWQEHEILAGSSLGFFILTISSFMHAVINKGWRRSLITISALALLIAIGGFVLSGSKLHEAAQLLQVLLK